MARDILPPPDFVKIVRETAKWCAIHGTVDDPEHSLRSADLAMPTPMQIWDQHNLTNPNYQQREILAFDAFDRQLEAMVRRRRELLEGKTLPSKVAGRLLVHDVFNTDEGGSSAVCSANFFDWADCPPHDTWVCGLRFGSIHSQHSFLISWIPEAFYAVAERGIDCCVLQCTDWIDTDKGAYWGHAILEKLHYEWQDASQGR